MGFVFDFGMWNVVAVADDADRIEALAAECGLNLLKRIIEGDQDQLEEQERREDDREKNEKEKLSCLLDRSHVIYMKRILNLLF